MRKIIVILAATTVAGCAVNSGVVQTGTHSYTIERQAATGFSGLGDLESKAKHEAFEFCSARGDVVRFDGVTESKPPYIFGNFPRASVNFTCAPKSSS